jgi:hypothetical protein
VTEHAFGEVEVADGVNRLLAARAYSRRGWAVLPVPRRSKNPGFHGWQQRRFTETDLPRYFSGDGNIGVRPGADSNWMVDVDLDCPEAIELADLYLPETAAVFGRASKPRSHRLYVARGATFEKFSDPFRLGPEYQGNEKACLLELRSDTAAGGKVQTIFPPSAHDDSGELIEWHGGTMEPTTVDTKVLRRCCAWLAAGCLIARYSEDGWEVARHPYLNMAQEVWNRVPSLGEPIYSWLGKFNPDELLHRKRPTIPNDADITEVVRRIPNDLDREGWVRVGLAIYAASGGSEEGYAAWVEFSRRSPRHHNLKTVQRVWRSFQKSPPRSISAGSLFWLAKEAAL